MFTLRPFHQLRDAWISVICIISFFATACAEPRPAILVENPGQIHALVIGIDNYHHIAHLKGADADARDIQASLLRIGIEDVTLLLDDEADRESILRAADGLLSRLKPGDLVILTIAGHGAQEPERIKGSEPDGKDTVFLLAGFAAAGEGTRQRIFDKEFNHLLRSFEAAGARILFVADTCSGGGLAREVDPRASEMSYRSTPSYKVTDDELKPIATSADAFTTSLSFDKTIFLAAADKNSKAPEIKLPGVDSYRGALSYAFARALEGAADTSGDGKITVKKLFDYVHQVTYQLSDERQNIVSASAPNLDTGTEVVVSRSVNIVNPQAPRSMQPADMGQTWGKSLRHSPVRIAAVDNNNAQLEGLSPETKYETVLSTQDPDLIWDAQSGDIISGGDVIARRADKGNLPLIIDRAAAVNVLMQIASHSPQSVRLLPNSRLYHGGERVGVEVDKLEGRALLLFNIAGDGTVQLLYPLPNESETSRKVEVAGPSPRPAYRIEIYAHEPYGADQIVAITAPHPMNALEQALRQLDKRKASRQLLKVLEANADDAVRLGTIGVFTAP